MALVSSIFGTQFSQRQRQIQKKQEVFTSKVRIQVWLWRVAIAVRQQTKGKHTPKIKVAVKTSKKNNMHANKPCFLTGLRHIFAIVSSQNFHYDGTNQRHLGARNNQSAMAIRNQPLWRKFPIQSFYYPCHYTPQNDKKKTKYILKNVKYKI